MFAARGPIKPRREREREKNCWKRNVRTHRLNQPNKNHVKAMSSCARVSSPEKGSSSHTGYSGFSPVCVCAYPDPLIASEHGFAETRATAVVAKGRRFIAFNLINSQPKRQPAYDGLLSIRLRML